MKSYGMLFSTLVLHDMKSRLKSPTKAERHRITWIKEDGCYACRKRGYKRHADAHHLLSGGSRISHAATVPLCEWHHRGIITDQFATESMLLEFLGPTLARHKRQFVDEFGTEADILEETDRRYMESCG